MDRIRDKGITSSMQYDRWIASKRAPKATRTQQVIRHPATFIARVAILAGLVALLVLQVTLGVLW
jgi:hypothetical protein